MTTFGYDFENGASGGTITTTLAGSNSAAGTYATGAAHGSLCGQFTSGRYIRWTFASTGTLAFRYYLQVSGLGSGDTFVPVTYMHHGSNALDAGVLYDNSTGVLSAIDGGFGAFAGPTIVITPGAWYRVEMVLSTTGAHMSVYAGDSTTALGTLTKTGSFGTDMNGVDVGSVGSISSGSIFIDDFAYDTAATSEIGPVATGGSPSTGSAAGSFTFHGAASGSRVSRGSVSRGVVWAGAASGARPSTGRAAGAFVFTGSATGATPHRGAATAGVTWSGTAFGSAPTVGGKSGGAAGTITWSGAATGTAPVVGGKSGTATGSITWSGAANGATPKSGAGTGGIAWAGAATGSAPTVGGHSGSAAGTISWHGMAAGATGRGGSGVATLTWSGAAHGVTARAGNAARQLTWAGAAHGTSGSVGEPVTHPALTLTPTDRALSITSGTSTLTLAAVDNTLELLT